MYKSQNHRSLWLEKTLSIIKSNSYPSTAKWSSLNNLWKTQSTLGLGLLIGFRSLGRGCLCALSCSFLASVPYAQFKSGGFRSVYLVLSGTIQSFWSSSYVCFWQLRCLAGIPNSKQSFTGGVNCQFCQAWHLLLWEIHYLLESILKLFLNICFSQQCIFSRRPFEKRKNFCFFL